MIPTGDYPREWSTTAQTNGPVLWPALPHVQHYVRTLGEHKDLSESEPAMLKKLLDRYNSYFNEPRAMQDQGYHVHTDVPTDKTACSYMAAHGGYWRPWRNVGDNR